MDLNAIYEMVKPQIVLTEIRQANGDSGDSAQRDGTWWALVGMINGAKAFEDFNYDETMAGHEAEPGEYRRTSNLSHWGHNPNNFSRDQFSALQLAFAVQGDKKRLNESALAVLERAGFMQNSRAGADCHGFKCVRIPDFVGLNNVGVFLRGHDAWYTYPLLCLLDVGFLLDVYLRKGVADADNLLMPQLAYAQMKLPTPVGVWAWHLYDRVDALQKLKRYHDVDPALGHNGIKGFYELFELLNWRLK